MIEYLIEEIRIQIRSIIESAIRPLKARLRRNIILGIILILVVLPLWFLGIYFLVCGLFFHFLGADILIHSALMTGLMAVLSAVAITLITTLIL